MVSMEPAKFVNDAVSKHVTVKSYMDRLTFAMLAAADANLVAHRYDGNAEVYRIYTRVDWYIILEDHAAGSGSLGALSIEYGHGEYKQKVKGKDGQVYEITVGASAPTYILTNATKIKRKHTTVKVSGADAKRAYKGKWPDSLSARISKIKRIRGG